MKRHSLLALSMILLVFSAGVTLAEDESPGEHETWSRFTVSGGGFLNAVDSRVMLGVRGLGVDIDVEEVLGLDPRTAVFRVDGFWRYTHNRRHRLAFSWFAVRRGTEHVIDRGIEIGDTLFVKGTRLKTGLDIDIFKGTYSYSFFQDDRIDLAVSAGLFVMPVAFEVSATREATKSARSADITAPLPVFGLLTAISLTPRWYLRSGFELLYLEIGDFRGAITDLTGAFEYKPYGNLGIGLGFDTFRLFVQARGNDYPGINFKGRIDFEYVGLILYVKGMW